MKSVGINKVFYSNDTGNIVCEKVKDMISIQASAAMRYMYGLVDTQKKFNVEKYFCDLLVNTFPESIKKYNFECFIKYNLINTLPDYKYTIEKDNIAIFNKKGIIIKMAKIL
jgi:hypothetical protein